ncbi:Uncharacterised protein [uncultured Clostridium sp.]|nr:Uncharacterised protein [uncultured Clostridium sp.]
MIENKLELLLSNPLQLGAEFDITRLDRNFQNVTMLKGAIENFFISNQKFTNVYYDTINRLVPQHIPSLLHTLFYTAMVYAYYLGCDYIHRSISTPEEFNYGFIKKSIQFEDPYNDDSDICSLYDHARKLLPGFLNQVTFQNDPMHCNPLIISRDWQRDWHKRTHFNGPLIKYLQKVFNDPTPISPVSMQEARQYKILDCFPKITLSALKANTVIPMGTQVTSGEYSIKKLRKLTDIVNTHMPWSENSDFESWLYTVLYEDIFHLNRLSNTLYHYIKYIDSIGKSTEKQQTDIVAYFFGLLYHSPTYAVQDLLYKNVKYACDAYLEANTKKMLIAISPVIFVNNILFPQLVLVLLFALYTDSDNCIESTDNIKRRNKFLEAYLREENDSSKHHLTLNPARFFWENADNYIELKRDKGHTTLSDGTIKKKILKNHELKPTKNRLSFERITGLLSASEPRWKYSYITEENMAFIGPQFTCKDRNKIFLKGSEPSECIGMSIRYSSFEYEIILYHHLLESIGLHDDTISKLKPSIEPYPNIFSLI